MADRAHKMDRKRTRDDGNDFLLIRAKGQYLRVPKDQEHEGISVSSGADNLSLSSKSKKRKKMFSRRKQRKMLREEKKTKKKNFFLKKAKSATMIKQDTTEEPLDTMDTQKPVKRKKRKRKRKNSMPTERDVEIQRLKEENEKEDKEIRKLEKLLNMKNKKKLPSQFKSDGLDYLFEVCDHQRFKLEDDSGEENDPGLEKYLQAFSRNKDKRKNNNKNKENAKMNIKENNDIDEEERDLDLTNDGDDDDDSKTDDFDDDNEYDQPFNDNISDIEDGTSNVDESDNDVNDKDDMHNDQGENSDYYDEDDDNDIESDEEIGMRGITKTNSSNSELNHDSKQGSSTASDGETCQENSTKYIPPHQRGTDSSMSKKEHLNKVKRQLKGLLNRLSEGNLQVVCNEIEELFNRNSRNDMNELLTSLILDSCVSSSLMPPKLLMEHSLLLAVLNSNIGMEVGAYFLQTLAFQFERLHKDGKSENSGKEIFNVVALFSHLYNFKVTHCGLIYDIIRVLSDEFQEQDIDLLLLILKCTGAEIRRDDPGSLKDIILQIQAKAASASDQSNDSRVRFMLEIISNLRNNNLRKIPGYDPSQVEHLRKLLRAVIRDYTRSSSSQLQISLQDLLEADTKGRWWIVGSAWSGRQESKDTNVTSSVHKWNSQLLELARKQRMNTDVKKNIFCVMMTSEDYVDAFEKLLRLNLKDVQAREIVHVLVDCCLKEKSSNPFYAYLGQKFCEYNRSYQVTFQYTFWDKFKVIDSLSESSVRNMSFLLSHLVASKALSLSILKAVNFMELEKPCVRLFRHFFTHLLTEYPADTVRKSFERIATLKDLVHLRQGMAIFIRHFIDKKKKREGVRSSNMAERIQSVMNILHSSNGSVL